MVYTCTRVLVFLALCPWLRSLPVVVAAPLIQPRVRAGAAVAQLAFPTADDCVFSVDLLRALETFFPNTLRVLPTVAVLPTGLHVDDDQEKSHNYGDILRGTSSPHPRGRNGKTFTPRGYLTWWGEWCRGRVRHKKPRGWTEGARKPLKAVICQRNPVRNSDPTTPKVVPKLSKVLPSLKKLLLLFFQMVWP